MSTITFDRNTVAQTATLLSATQDSNQFLLLDEHTSEKPEVLSVRRKLAPGGAGTVHRCFITRQKSVVINDGTDDSIIMPITAKIELSVPVGAEDLDVDAVLDDIKGCINATWFVNTKRHGILPNG